MPPKHVESELDKLILWANNVGAVCSGESYEFSLDYRLRDSPFYQERVRLSFFARFHTGLGHSLR